MYPIVSSAVLSSVSFGTERSASFATQKSMSNKTTILKGFDVIGIEVVKRKVRYYLIYN